MDPDATYRLMVDESNDLDERAVAATDLLVWLVRQGASPKAVEMGRARVTDECKHHIFKALDRLAEFEALEREFFDKNPE